MIRYETLVQNLDAQIPAVLTRQVMDPSREDFGGFVSDGVAAPTSVSTLSTLGYAYLLPESKFYQSEEILARILAGTQFGRQARRESGCYDLITTNFDSSPDTGFMVKAIGPIIRAARKVDTDGSRQVAESLGEIVQTALPGMVAGGFHTPNHRWVLVGALSLALELFPESDGMDMVEKYLAETIDINADGEYIERSAGVYNAVCNRALRLAAEALDRPELLDPVRRNLDLSYHLLHSDGTVVTSFSGRQDRGQRIVLVNMADSYYHMARRDGNGFYAAVADWLCASAPTGGGVLLEPFLTHPEWREDDLAREPLPERYSNVYPKARLWRVRNGKTSATAGAGITAPFSVKHGEVNLTSVNFCASYFAIAQFAGESFDEVDDGIQMTHVSKSSDGRRPGYDQPFGHEVPFDDFYKTRKDREVYALNPLTTTVKILEVDGGFDLHLTADGYDRVPFQIACDFTPGGELDFESGVMRGQVGEVAFLKSGSATYHVGTDAISIGPGAYGHRFWQMRGSESAPNAFRVLMTFMTPVEHKVEIRCGTWSTAEERILQEK
ncbi:MAG: hypothetical protein HOH77_13025 [Candidatus Latescibacteria bacterium]|jgi:hypothetical protein|nr:hypothetical protein [Candidatus Latescibacterota bacterium]